MGGEEADSEMKMKRRGEKTFFFKMKRCNWCDLVSSRKPTAESAKERCRLNVHGAYDFVM